MRKIFYFLCLLILILAIFGFYFFQKRSQPKEKLKPVETLTELKLISSVFENNSLIPSKYTCDGENVNPPLEIKDIPEGTESLVLIVDDPDAPRRTFLHWLVWNIPPDISLIEENSLPEGAIQGRNDFGKESYGGPCPPSGTHRYFFKVYAIDKKLDLAQGSTLNKLEEIIEGHILDQTQLIGLYQRKKENE